MKTNHLMLQELLKIYHPKSRGLLNNEEHNLVSDTLCLKEMDILQLRNLRDYTVASMSRSENLEDWDRMSAITYCIDWHICEIGGEV